MECLKREPCLREINPEEFPGVFWGKPHEADEDCGCCVSCHTELDLIRRLEELAIARSKEE